MARDKRAEPRPGQHVPYVVVCGPPGVPLFTLVHEPAELQRNPALRLNGTYYVTKMLLPALHRITSLMKLDVYAWYRNIPRTFVATSHFRDNQNAGQKSKVNSADLGPDAAML